MKIQKRENILEIRIKNYRNMIYNNYYIKTLKLKINFKENNKRFHIFL